MWIETYTEEEKAQWKNIVRKKKLLGGVRSNTNLVYVSYEPWTPSEYQTTYDKVKAIHSPELKRQGLKIFKREKINNKRID